MADTLKIGAVQGILRITCGQRAGLGSSSYACCGVPSTGVPHDLSTIVKHTTQMHTTQMQSGSLPVQHTAVDLKTVSATHGICASQESGSM